MISCSLFLAVSLHLGYLEDLNSVHPGVRCEEAPWAAGTYYNSEERISVFGSYTLDSDPWFAEFGVLTGYSNFELPVVPFVRFGYQYENVKLFIAPAGEAVSRTNEYGVTRIDIKIKPILGMEISF